MSVIDVLLLGAILIVAVWWIAFPSRARHILRLAPLGLLALAVLQIALQGFYWQFVPAYLLIGVFDLLSIFSRRAPAGALAMLGRAGLLALVLAALGPFMLMLPVPTLPGPGGSYAVGTEIFRWVDAAHDETATSNLTDRRNVIAQAWYPAAQGVRGKHSIYMDGLDDLPEMISLLPGFLLRSYRHIDTHAVEHAPVAQDRPQWPVVLFSPGYGAPRAFYTSILVDLASRGYVVLALDHPYESAVTQLADGRIVAEVQNFPVNGSEDERDAFMVAQLNTRVSDIRFVLDQLSTDTANRQLFDRLDAQHIAVIGHSFGGAAAATAADRDPRIRAAANIDGTLYGDIAGKRLSRPFLLLDSDHVETGHSDKNLAENRRLLANVEAPGWAYEIKRANHYSFTDAPLFLAPPGRWVLSLAIGGERGPVETQRATVDILDAFLSAPLGRTPMSIESVATKYKDIDGGATNEAAGH